MEEKKKKIITTCVCIVFAICLIAGLIVIALNQNGQLTGTAGVSDKDTGNVELVGMREDGMTLYITTKTGTSVASDSIKDFIAKHDDYSSIYPGAIVEPNTSAISATQKEVDENNITRDKLGLSVNVKGESSVELNIENPNKETIANYIRKELKSHSGKAETNVRYAMVNSEEQLVDELGLPKQSHRYGMDYKAISLRSAKFDGCNI